MEEQLTPELQEVINKEMVKFASLNEDDEEVEMKYKKSVFERIQSVHSGFTVENFMRLIMAYK
jgi:hypothetical protein